VEPLDPRLYRDLVRRALEEDVRDGDVTTEAIVPADVRARGTFLIKSEGVLAGLEVAFEVFRQLDTGPLDGARGGPVRSFAVRVRDGEWCRPGTEVADVVAPARTLLVGERTALNYLQRLSGIATLARRFAKAANGRITILDTRKTTPTLRALEKYAVRVGGGTNHRSGLFDAILIKDNHIALAGGVKAAIDHARTHRPAMPIEIEAATLHDVDLALAEGVEVIMLDNMSTADIRIAVARAKGRAKTEISGGVTLERLPELAATGADFVSVGALTHSAPAIDISFEIQSL
jgi:nicotinate-nucleotide pyrophosphorylase (carboxylating)